MFWSSSWDSNLIPNECPVIDTKLCVHQLNGPHSEFEKAS